MNQSKALVDTRRSKYQVGQVWRYRNRLGEDSSTITIVKVELQHSESVVVHITVSNVKIHSEELNRDSEISHMPFSEEALETSVVELLDMVVDLPDFEDGYEDWKEAFLNGNAGVFSVSVAKAVDFIEKAMSSAE
jgi:hypothetical protein